MVDTTLVIPKDLKTEIEEVSRREHRTEVDVLRDALRQYIEQQPASRLPRSIEASADDALHPAKDEEYVKANWMLNPRVPQSIGIARSGRIQSDEVDQWLEKNWERDW